MSKRHEHHLDIQEDKEIKELMKQVHQPLPERAEQASLEAMAKGIPEARQAAASRRKWGQRKTMFFGFGGTVAAAAIGGLILFSTEGVQDTIQGWFGDDTEPVDDHEEENETDNYEVEVEVSPAEGGTVTGAGHYAEGEEVRLEVEPAEGFRISHWEKERNVSPWQTERGDMEGDFYVFEVEHNTVFRVEFEEYISSDHLPDTALREAIREELEIEGDLTMNDLESLTSLDLSNEDVTDLSGLEYAEDLDRLIADSALIDPEDRVRWMTELNIPAVEITDDGLDPYRAVDDLEVDGHTAFFESDENLLVETFGPPDDTTVTEEGYQLEPAGLISDVKAFEYPAMTVYYREDITDASQEEENRTGFFDRFHGVRIHSPGVTGPRGIEVGDSVEEVAERFPLAYRIDESADGDGPYEATNSYANVDMANGQIETIFFRSSLFQESEEYRQAFDLSLIIEDGEVAVIAFDYMPYRS